MQLDRPCAINNTPGASAELVGGHVGGLDDPPARAVAARAGATRSEIVGSHVIYEFQPAAVAAADLIKQTWTGSLSC